MQNKILVIAGPTASGKTGLSVALAEALNGEIISADSMQVYKYMNIGTAKVTAEEAEGIPHYLVDFLEPTEKFSVAEFCRLAKEHINDILSRGKLPIVVGGTGLYINSLIDGIKFIDRKGDDELRDKLYSKAEEEGPEAVHAILRELDSDTASEIHPNNVIRVVRAIEMFYQTGSLKQDNMEKSRENDFPYDFLYLGLNARDRQFIYDRINLRVDLMIENGLLDETKLLINMGFGQTSANAIGYKELIAYIEGKLPLATCLEQLKQSSRRYAKRQLTWFRRDARINWLYIDDYKGKDEFIDDALSKARDFLES